MKTFKTPKGTEIVVSDIKGRDYMQVNQRLIWFREEHPDWRILTEIIHTDENGTLAKATIANELGSPIATAHKSETKKGFEDHIEKSETGAVGRALGFCGYGTQFAPELDEGERLAEAPIDPKKPKTESKRVEEFMAAVNQARPMPEHMKEEPPWPDVGHKQTDAERKILQNNYGTHDSPAKGMLMPYGRYKGKPASDMDDESLQWMINKATVDVADKSKGKWKHQNQDLLDCLLAEQAHRKASGPPPFAADEEIPF